MTKSQKNIYNWLSLNKGYLKCSPGVVMEYYWNYLDGEETVYSTDVDVALKKARQDFRTNYVNPSLAEASRDKYIEEEVIDKPKSHVGFLRPIFDVRNTLVIGDTHEPFCKDGYLEHCLKIQKDYNCGRVVHIGDLVDNHAVSYHENDPDGRSPGDEYKLALSKCKEWYKAFPEVSICIGNHDKLPFRKAFTAGLPKNWLKSYQEMFESPILWNWDFIHKHMGVIYQHGTGMSGEMASVNAARENRQSTVIGHLHTVSNIRFLASQKDLIFGMSVGCGIDHEKYAFAYGREATRKPVLSCGVVINGELPINIPMKLS